MPCKRAKSLIRLLSKFSDNPFYGAEIGVYTGAVSAALLRRFTSLRLWMVDSWATYPKDHPGWKTKDRAVRITQQEQDENYQTAVAVTEFAADRRVVCRMSSQAVAEQFCMTPLDFVFIDGDHSFAGVKLDISLWYQKVKPGGLLTGHDYGSERYTGVTAAVDEFAEQNGLPIEIESGKVWMIRKSC